MHLQKINKCRHRILSHLSATLAVMLLLSMLMSLAAPSAAAEDLSPTTAPIAILMCYNTGEILYDRNMEQRWIPASMTKIMTAFIVFQELEAGNLTLDTEIIVGEEAARFSAQGNAPGINIPMRRELAITVETLLRLVLITSDNTACVVFAEHISGSEEAFVERMNETAARLGMYGYFVSSHGASIHHTNAYSIALLIREFISRFPDVLRITVMPSVNFGGRTYNNTNHLVRGTVFEGADGFKTGSLRQARWNHSTTAERDGRRLIAVVMNTPSNSARQQQSRLLLDYGFELLEQREVARGRMNVLLNSRRVQMDTRPAVLRGEAMLPLQSIARHVGYSATWHEEYGVIVVASDNGEITLFVDRGIIILYGVTHKIDTPAQIFEGEVFVSLELVEIITETTANWNEESGLIHFRRR